MIDLSVPRAQYLHNAWKRHQDAVYWVDINLAIEKGLKFYQTRSNAIILQGTLPAYCIPKVVKQKTGEVLYEKVYLSPRPPPKISLKHEWKRELGSEVARQPEGEVAQQPEGEVARQAQFFQQPNQFQIQFVKDRGDLMTCKMEETRPVPRRSLFNEAWKNRIAGVMAEKSYRDYDGIDGEPTEFEWNIFPGFTTLQLCGKINDLVSDLGENTRNFHRKNSIHVNVQ